MKRFSTLILCLVIVISAVAQKTALDAIDQKDLKANMEFFASDALDGRETGTPENFVAAQFIKSQLMRMGVPAGSESGDYFQNIPLTSKLLSPKGTSLNIHFKDSGLSYTTDSVIFLISPSDTLDISGEVLFAGYGIDDPELEYNDYEGVDASGRIVMVMTENPDIAGKVEDPMMFNPRIENRKIGSIYSKKPKAMLFVYNPLNAYTDAYDSGLAEMLPGGKVGSSVISYSEEQKIGLPFPVIFITRNTADMILSSSGFNLEQLEAGILKESRAKSQVIASTKVNIRAIYERSKIESPNVIAMIEGSDPMLKKECVVYSAHFDHVGRDGHGEVRNGADDNASGSIALLEIAEAFSKLKKAPRRSIIFAWVNGEEKGLYGSRYYVENPYIPMENTLLNINLDMVGRSESPADTGKFMGFDLDVTGEGEIRVYTAHESSEVMEIMMDAGDKSGIKVIDMGPDLEFGGSDHMSFLEKGVPALFFNTGMHADLHGAGDDVNKIDFNKMEKVSKMVFLIGNEVANKKERIKLDGEEE